MRYGLAWSDLSTGEFEAGEFDADGLAAELQRIRPAELLVPGDVEGSGGLVGSWNRTAAPSTSVLRRRSGRLTRTRSYTSSRWPRRRLD